jgi:hypothetical protein
MTASVAAPELAVNLGLTNAEVAKIRADFPILHTKVHGHDLVYLDNAATSQKPQAVIDAIVRYYTSANANIHRGVHYLSQLATEEFEAGRTAVQKFIHAAKASEIIFTRGTTEGINLVAQSYVRTRACTSGRRSRGDGDGTPLRHRAVADAVRGKGRDAEGCADQRRRRADPERV